MNSNTYEEMDGRNGATRVVRNSKANSLALKAGIFSAALLMLGGCGGGGGSSDSGSSSTGSNGGSGSNGQVAGKITGKAIDGYLANAKVCFDDGHGGCDASLPSTTTDSSGNYSLNTTNDVAGRQINVIVTPDTIDLSTGLKFSSTFALSAVVNGTTQNITPFTTMVVAQIKTGRTQEQALAAVRTLTGSASTDPAADYIASGDKFTSAVAASMVSQMQALAGSGPISWTQVQATMNAYAAAGTTQIQQSALIAMLADPALSTQADASSVLSSPLYTVSGNVSQMIPMAPPSNGLSPVREAFTLSDTSLITQQEVQQNGSWAPASPQGSYDGPLTGTWAALSIFGNYSMKVDGSWTEWLDPAAQHPTFALQSGGATLVGTHPYTGDTVRVSYRTMDVSGWPLSTSLQIDYRNPTRGAMQGSFAAGTTGYLATMAYDHDQLILTNYGAGTALINGVPSAYVGTVANGLPLYSLGDPTATYTSVRQLIDTQFMLGNPCTGVTVKGDGTVVFDKTNGTGCNYGSYPYAFPVVGSWSIYPRNPQVITISLPKAMGVSGSPISDNVKNVINAGGSLVVALKDGKLLSGFMMPATAPATVLQFRASVLDTIAAAMRDAAARNGQTENP